jgi:hypothetical protein
MEDNKGLPGMALEQRNDCQERERDALRIQAAAVSAQQAALFEDEIRIRRREGSVEEQETQLAAHLDERQHKLIDLRDQIGRARADFEADRQAKSQNMAELARQVSIEHSAALDALKWAAAQRRRLWRLRVQLRKRLHRHWQACQRAQAEGLRALEGDRQRLDHDRNCVRSERDILAQMRKRLTGETELSRRQIEDAWRTYRRELERQSALRARERQEIETARKDVSGREQQLAAETSRWELRRERLQMEVAGLETRIQNARLKLLEPSAPTHAVMVWEPEPAQPVSDRLGAHLQGTVDGSHLRALGQMTAEIADQRAHLVEHWQQLLQARSAFEEERQQTLYDLETLAAALEAQRLEARSVAERLGREAEASRRCRQKILAEQAEWRSRQAVMECEAQAARAEWQFRIDQVTHQLARLQESRKMSSERQTRRWECAQRSLQGASRLRQSYVRLRRQWVARLQGIIRQERQVAERALAVEQYWQECISQASDPVAAEKRLESIRRQWVRSLQEAATRLGAERREFECLVTAVNERALVIDRQVKDMAALDGELGVREQALQQHVLDFRACQSEQDRDHSTIQAHRDALAQENARLREELENVAAQLLDDEPPRLQIAA